MVLAQPGEVIENENGAARGRSSEGEVVEAARST